MRSLTPAQLAVLDDVAYSAWLRVLIADADGVMRDYGAQGGYDLVDGVEIVVDVDQPATQATVQLRRDVIDGSGTPLSLSPFRSDSTLNRNSLGAYAPAIDAGRAIQIFVATTPAGIAPVTADWQNLFEGTIDDIDIANTSITVTARDMVGLLLDRYVEVETNYGSDVGVPLETVMQQILDDWAPGIALACPISPEWDITPYTQSRVPVMDALQTLAGLRGWDVRPKWDTASASWKLTLYLVERTKSVPDRIISPSRYLAVNQLKIGRDDVRNVIWAWYTDSATGTRQRVESKDDASIARFGRLWMEVDEAANSPIDTPGEAQTFTDSMRDDLKDPKADQTIEEHFDWSVELGDLQRYTANGKLYDTDQDWAVVSYRHNLAPGKFRTTVAVRGKPCGRYLDLIKKRNTPVSSPSTAGPTLIVTAQVNPGSVTINAQNTGTLTLSTDGGVTFGDLSAAGVTSFPTVVARQNVTTGGTAQRWVFKASLNGQEITHPVDIPATDPPPAPKVPPDYAYATGVAVSNTVAVHAEYAGRIVFTAVPSARTELDAGTRFGLDATPFGYARIVAQVQSAGPGGSYLALEYFDTSSATWKQACVTDATCPIDSTGTHLGTSQTLVAAVTGDTLFRVMTQGGDGATGAELGNVHVIFIQASAGTTTTSTTQTKLYLRDTPPATAPAGSSFPMSSALPVETLTKSTGWDTPLALLTTKGTGGADMGFLFTFLNGTYDAFSRVFISNPFAANQTIPAGTWEFGAAGIAYQTPCTIRVNPVLYVLRNTGGTWSKVATIYDAHTTSSPPVALSYNTRRAIKVSMSAPSVSVQAGDVIAFEGWVHASVSAGALFAGPFGEDASVRYDGPLAIPVGAVDGGTYDEISAFDPASYILAPAALNLT